MIGNLLIYICAGFVLLLHIYLSERRTVYVGGIIPILYLITFLIGWTAGLYTVSDDIVFFLVVGLGGLILLFSIWGTGRKKYKSKQIKERQKMELKDF